MMKATDAGQPDNSGLRRRAVLGASPDRGIPKPSVDSIFVVVVDVFAQQASKVVLVQNDYVIEQFSAGAANPSFGNTEGESP